MIATSDVGRKGNVVNWLGYTGNCFGFGPFSIASNAVLENEHLSVYLGLAFVTAGLESDKALR